MFNKCMLVLLIYQRTMDKNRNRKAMHNMLNLYPARMGMTTTPQCIPTASKARSTAKNFPIALILPFILMGSYKNYAVRFYQIFYCYPYKH